MTTQLTTYKCDGGQYSCSPPKECCRQGCCFLLAPSVYRPPSVQTGNVFANPLFLGHWYFWLAVTATVAGILCACSLWRKHSQGGLCCRGGSTQGRACSEPDSIGSCYAPPQYSRCNSFQQPPPPYSEVASKPDLYPLVITYNNSEPAIKNNNTSTGYLMVQYFRNFIVRPVGSLSAASTNDSLSSSFLCNAVNDANTIVPPTYSNVASLEELVSDPPHSSPSISERQIPRSASSVSSAPTEYHQVLQLSPSATTHVTISSPLPPITPIHTKTSSTNRHHIFSLNEENSSFETNMRNVQSSDESSQRAQSPVDPGSPSIDYPPPPRMRRPPIQRSVDSAEDEEPANFSALLNLSVCAPNPADSPPHPQATPMLQELHFGVTNSMTGSDISSLANLGTPDSPPRATSPTVEMRELLDKIQQLPAQRCPAPTSTAAQARAYFHRVRAKTLYMPLGDAQSTQKTSKAVPSVFSRGWLSRSAPSTPCAPLAPNFASSRGSQRGSKAQMTDDSPLLKQHAEESEDDPHRDEYL